MATTSKKTQTISITATVRESWGIAKKNYLKLLAILVLSILVSTVMGSGVEMVAAEYGTGANIAGTLFSQIVSLIVSVGVMKAMLDIVDGKKISLDLLWKQPVVLWNYFLASLVYSVLVIVGILLLVVPGIYLAIKYGQYGYLIIDKKLGAIAALKESARITDGVKWQLLFLSLALSALNILGFLALLVGLFVTVPISAVAPLLVYRKLAK